MTPPDFGDFTRMSIIEAGHYAAGAAYVAANRYQLQDDSPLSCKTTDFGKTWTQIVNGLRPPISRAPFARIRCGAGCSSPPPSAACT